MSARSQETLRRGWCPSTLRPMETGDGWLVRLAPEDPGEIGALLDSEGYQAVLDSENE